MHERPWGVEEKQMFKTAALAALLALGLIACEHPDEPDQSAERRAGVDAPRRDAIEPRRSALPPDAQERAALPTLPGPRTSTPGGVAAGLHGEHAPTSGAGGDRAPDESSRRA